MGGWELPLRAEIGGKQYGLHCDFRDVLEIFSYFSDPDLPDYIKWQIALALFFEGEIPPIHQQQAMEYLSWFLSGGRQEEQSPGPQLLDWEQDCDLIAADVNRAAGMEIRAVPFLHWWTFLSWFHAMPPGELSTRISLRQKLRKGQPLEDWEKEYYRENKALVDLRPAYTEEEKREIERLNKLLGA